MDRERILELIELLKASSATELEVRDGDLRVRIVRAARNEPAARAESAGEAAARQAQQAAIVDGVLVHSHVVGYFRRTDADTGEVLAKPGDRVKKGQPIARIETLGRSVMVEAPADGEVIEFLAEDGESVQYATPLARLRPA